MATDYHQQHYEAIRNEHHAKTEQTAFCPPFFLAASTIASYSCLCFSSSSGDLEGRPLQQMQLSVCAETLFTLRRPEHRAFS